MDDCATVNTEKYQYCIIAGAPRCGTTSLYEYLGDHPQVCSSFVKQTSYFLDSDYDGVVSHSINSEKDYEELFDSKDHHTVKLESTPDYLYSPGSAKAISAELGDDVFLIFILRHPVEQYISLYNHYKRLGMIATDSSIDEFIALEFDKDNDEDTMLLKKGNYHLYLEEYFRLYSSDNICVIFTDNLSEKPIETLDHLSAKLNLSPGFYSDYSFKSKNMATEVKSRALLRIYQQFRFRAISLTQNNKVLMKTAKPARRLISSIYKKLNSSPAKVTAISDNSKSLLAKHYQVDLIKLEELLGKSTPWKLEQ